MSGEIIVERERRRGFVFRLLANTAAIGLTAWVLPGVAVKGLLGALIAALLLSLVNTFVRPVILFLTLPLTVMTLGLFVFVVNGISLLLAAWIAGDLFVIRSFGSAILAWLLVSLINWAITSIFKKEKVTVR